MSNDKGDYRFSLDLPKHYVGATGIVLNDKGQVLLQKRSDKLTWEMPGGVVELDEKIEDAVLREIFEETGIKAEIIGFVGLYKNMKRGILNFSYLCRPVGGEFQTSDESIEIGYFTPEKAFELLENPRQIIRLKDALDKYAGSYEHFHITYTY
ncbi:NUDIX hydrolase [Brevibacillus sp. SAFN-007a]|uniref:NUDIX hydrolase n=1 Tax=Brevibacillus sp. SAFN-007a TaxID=3436862 RepID=UPI003F8145D3